MSFHCTEYSVPLDSGPSHGLGRLEWPYSKSSTPLRQVRFEEVEEEEQQDDHHFQKHPIMLSHTRQPIPPLKSYCGPTCARLLARFPPLRDTHNVFCLTSRRGRIHPWPLGQTVPVVNSLQVRTSG